MQLADEARSFEIVVEGGDMRITTLIFSILCLTLFAACQQGGGGNTKPSPTARPTSRAAPSATPAKVSKALETPCANGKLISSHAYSEVGEQDGFWHVVQDDDYNCPPVTTYRVADTPTTVEVVTSRGQLNQFPPNPIGIAYKDFHKDTTCQSPRPLDRTITISACDDNDYWVRLTYNLYECLDKSLALTEPPDKTVKTKVQCDKVMPHP
jgi:hypothetical protein